MTRIPRTALLLALFTWGCGDAPSRNEAPPSSPAPPAGTIAGRVRFAARDPGLPPEPPSHVFVYVKDGIERKDYPVPAEPVVLDQISFQFVPRVFGIRAGQTLKITSQDASQHNVFCQPFKNPGFNVSMFAGESAEKKFPSPEVMILLQCNIHHIMKAYAGVLDHPFFAVSDGEGAFEIRGLPPGRYMLAAWQEFKGGREIEVVLPEGHGVRVEIRYP